MSNVFYECDVIVTEDDIDALYNEIDDIVLPEIDAHALYQQVCNSNKEA